MDYRGSIGIIQHMIKIIKQDNVYHLYINGKDVWLSHDEVMELQNVLNNRDNG